MKLSNGLTVREKNQKFWKRNGLTDKGEAWIVNNKFAKAADMKPLGARWNPELGWHFDSPHDDTFYMSATDLGEFDLGGNWSFKYNIIDIIDKKRNDLIPPTDSEYIGNIGEKVELKAVFEKESSFEASYSYYNTTTVYVLTFKVNGKDTVVWMTSSEFDLEEGKMYILDGNIKDHREYKKDKQTILTRCKIKEY